MLRQPVRLRFVPALQHRGKMLGKRARLWFGKMFLGPILSQILPILHSADDQASA
jgi:hypothetical protein